MRRNSLLFPKLVKVNTLAEGEVGPGKAMAPDIYALVWDAVEDLKEREFRKWNDDCWPKVKMEYVPALPDKWREFCDGMAFAIPDKYMQEINRCTAAAIQEGQIKRVFDTVIREMCLMPRDSFVEVVFRLISDCLCVSECTNATEMNARRRLSISMLLYRFWMYQTGRGLVFNLARLNDDTMNFDMWTEFKRDIIRQQDLRNAEYDKMVVDQAHMEGQPVLQ